MASAAINSNLVIPTSRPADSEAMLGEARVEHPPYHLSSSSYHASKSLYKGTEPVITYHQETYPDTSNSGEEHEYEEEELNDRESEKREGDSFRAKKRRKQSNPVRITSSSILEPELNLAVEEECTNAYSEFPPQNFADEGYSDRYSSSSTDQEKLIKCTYCFGSFRNIEELKIHEEHLHKQHSTTNQNNEFGDLPLNLSNNKHVTGTPSPTMSVSPKLEHQTDKGSLPGKYDGTNAVSSQSSSGTVQTTTSFPDMKFPPLPGMLPFGPHPLLFPFLSQGPSSSTSNPLPQTPPTSGNGPPIRIFNPEAYCELCNKEFCNKYFLKTHKANKHGIYTGEGQTITTASLTPTPYVGHFMSATMNVMNGVPLRPIIPSQSIAPNMTPSFLKGDVGTATKPGAVINIESYCEICQKEFCNKYFLKRHKAKIHGIIVDEKTAALVKQSSNVRVPTPSSKEDFSPKSTGEMRFSPDTDVKPQFEGFCKICSRDCGNKHSLYTHVITTHGLSNGRLETLPPLPRRTKIEKTEDMWGNDESRFSDHLGRLSPSKSYNSDTVQQPAIANSKSYCELCCKDFGSRYALLTHKSQMHLASPQYEEEPPNNMQTVCSSPEQKQPEMKPCIEEDATTKESTLLKQDYQNREDTSKEQDEDPQCQDCGRPFVNPYLLQMHRYYFHSESENVQKEEQNQSQKEVNNSEESNKTEEPPPPQPTQQVEEEKRLDLPEVKSADENERSGEDLQKLQSMIMELNSATSQVGKVTCHVCSKEVENKYYLTAHMLNEHGLLHTEEQEKPVTSGSPSPTVSNPSSTPIHNSHTFCNICKKEFYVKYFLHQHMQNAHRVQPFPPNQDITPRFNQSVPAAPNSQTTERRDGRSSTNRSYCEICNKELCNKYFMKTHMLKMHGINVENGAMLGGVVCDICNKELCSKYFLKVHKQNTHGILEDISPATAKEAQPAMQQIPRQSPQVDRDKETPESGRQRWMDVEKPANVGIKCPVCGHTCHDQVAMHVHMIKSHAPTIRDPLFHRTTKEPSEGTYRCGFCPFTSSVPAALWAHEKLHVPHHRMMAASLPLELTSTLPLDLKMPVGTLQCPLCFQPCPSMDSFHQHLLSHQLNPFFRGAPFMDPRLLNGLSNKDGGVVEKREEEEEEEEGEEEKKLGEETQTEDLSKGSNLPPLTSTPSPIRKYRCSVCCKRFRSRQLCLTHIHTNHNERMRKPLPFSLKRFPKSVFRCKKCGFSCKQQVILKRHIRQEHKPLKSAELPTAVAMPRAPPSTGTFIMQPFLLAQPEKDEVVSDSQFVPSLVYLPVSRKVSQTLTVSFTLTPA